MRQFLLLLLFILVFPLLAGVAKVTAVKGEAYLKRADATSVLTKGMELEEKDSIETGDVARVQIIFNDETVITLGKKTLFKIEEFLFDEKNAKANFNVAKGFFKSMTGQIGKVAPNRFKLKTKTSTIGIRGTHFIGLIDDEKDVIGCTSGTISVTSDKKTVDVFAGEMVTVIHGLAPSTPEPINMKQLQDANVQVDASQIKAKIASLQLKNGGITFDKSEIMSILDNIAQIKETDARRGLEDELNDHLNTAFKAGLFELFNKNDASNTYLTNFTGDITSYTPLTWGIVTKDKIGNSGTFFDKLNTAVPIQTYYELPNDIVPTVTETSIISGFMGESNTPHWDGNGADRKVMGFEGSVIAVSDANTFSATADFPADYDLSKFSAISPDATNNQVSMTVDFGNRVWYSLVKFDIQNAKTGLMETYTLVFDSLGQNAINSTGLNKYGIYYELNNQTITSLDAYTWRYYGDGIEQIGGNFNLIRNDGSTIVGSMILNNTASLDLDAFSSGTMSGFDWGYWAEGDVSTNQRGAWITPISGVSETATETIQSYIAGNVFASYAGGVEGTVHDPFVGQTELIQSGVVSMLFDFTSQNMDGLITFDAGSENWNVTITDAPVTTGGFSFTQSNVSASSVGTAGSVVLSEGSGKFYGANAEYVGGGFEMMDNSGKIAIGAFGAGKE